MNSQTIVNVEAPAWLTAKFCERVIMRIVVIYLYGIEKNLI